MTAGSVGAIAFLGQRALLSWMERSLGEAAGGAAKSDVAQIGAWLAAIPIPPFWKTGWSDEALEDRLRKAGLPWRSDSFHGLRWLVLWSCLLLMATLVFEGSLSLLVIFTCLLLLFLGVGGPSLFLRLRRDRREREIERALPDFLDRMTLGLEAGLGFEVALRRAAAGFGSVLGEEIRRCMRMLDLGHTKAHVLDDLAHRNPSQDLRGFATSVKQAERLGTSLAATLRVQSEILRARRRRRAEEASRRLPVLVVFPLVFFFLPALLIIYLAPPLLHLFLR